MGLQSFSIRFSGNSHVDVFPIGVTGKQDFFVCEYVESVLSKCVCVCLFQGFGEVGGPGIRVVKDVKEVGELEGRCRVL